MSDLPRKITAEMNGVEVLGAVTESDYYSQAVINEKDALLREAESVIRELRDANDADGRSITYIPVIDLIRANLGDES